MYAAIQGVPGDLFVGFLIVCFLLAMWRKAYKTGVGFLFLICGIVVVRVFISMLHGGADFSR